MTVGTSDGIHVVGLSVENLHRLRFAEVRLLPGGKVVRVTGKNGSGKSSLLHTIREAIGGQGEVLPVAVNGGSEDGRGEVRLELSNGFTVTRRITEANPKGYLKVVGPDGGEHKQSKLNEWLGEHHDFDVLSFFTLRPERQREILLSLGRDPELAAKLADLKSKYGETYALRTPHISDKRRAAAVVKPEGDRPTPIDVSVEAARLEELQAKQRARRDRERAVEDAERSVESHLEKIQVATREVEELESRLETAREGLIQMRRRAEELERDRTRAVDALDASPPVDDELAATMEQIAAADRVNRELEPWKAYDRAQDQHEIASREVDTLTAELERIQDEERALIAGAGIPVEGLTFDESGHPLLNGLPLEVASGGERIRMAIRVAIAANPALKIVLVDEGNDLDLDALAELDHLAEEHGFQIWLCRIGLEGPGEILVEDGEARTVSEPEQAVT